MAWRFMPEDFKMKSTYGHVEKSTLEDWPVSYEDLEPYYEKAEWEIGLETGATADTATGNGAGSGAAADTATDNAGNMTVVTHDYDVVDTIAPVTTASTRLSPPVTA